MMTWSYIAGYFDGEGHVNLHLTKRGDWTRGLAWYNTHLPSLEAIRDFIGAGRIQSRQPKGTALGKKLQHTLHVTRKLDLIRIIDALEPYLLIKREAALVLRQHVIDHVDETRYENHGKVAALSDEELNAMYWVEGLSYPQMAERIGVDRSSIAQAFKLRGLTARPSGYNQRESHSEETKQKMRESRRRLWSDPEFVARQAELRRVRRESGN